MCRCCVPVCALCATVHLKPIRGQAEHKEEDKEEDQTGLTVLERLFEALQRDSVRHCPF